MFYLFTKSILIEIGIYNQQYYIGNQIYKSIPASIINNCYSSANWNRALKYKNNREDENEIDQKYFMLDVNVYWNLSSNKIELVSNIFFFNEIINFQHFFSTFLDLMLSHYFKHTLSFPTVKKIDPKFIKKFKPEIFKNNLKIENIDNFLITNNNLNFKNKKFKSISILQDAEFSWETNKLNQIVYVFPKSAFTNISLVEYADFVDLNKNEFYINSLSKINSKLILELCLYSYESNKKIIKLMIKIINKSNDKLKNWHLYNLTNEKSYLIKELSKISKMNVEINSYLKEVYPKLKRNYDKEIADILRNS